MIIATTVDGGFQAHCLVGVYPPSSEAVDLGLSVKWAACNIGALHPEQYGCYFAWGETEPKLCYDWKTYIFGADSKGPFSKYVLNPSYGIVDERSVLDPEDDAATVYLGEGWRMPTEAEWTELKNNCTWEWTSDYNGTGVAGRIVTSKMRGYTNRSIFLPAAGSRSDVDLYDAGSYGFYWSSSLYTGSPYGAWDVYFDSDDVLRRDNLRYYGFSVRPVTG